jgi:hypothetical protein
LNYGDNGSSICGPMTPSPSVSVVLVPIDGELGTPGLEQLSRSIAAVERQSNGQPIEIIVPHGESGRIRELRAAHPGVKFLSVPVSSARAATAQVEELRAAAVRASRGEIVIVTEDHVQADPDWIEQMAIAHRQKHAAIGGAIENGEDRWMNWATYFADLGRYHNPVRSVESGYASVVNVSYKRAALDRIAAVWDARFNETEVHAALMAAGESIALWPGAIVRQHRRVSLGDSLGEFFEWGSCYGRARANLVGPGRRLAYLAASPLIPGVLLFRAGADAWRKKRLLDKWIRCLPLSIALNTAWAFGEAAGYLIPGSDRR